jgi:transcriptional regulator with XRE-family HTH domain
MWKSYPVPAEVATAIASGASRVRAFREYDGVSLSALALTAGITAERMVQIEEGADPTDDELRDIGDALAVPISMLVGMSG